MIERGAYVLGTILGAAGQGFAYESHKFLKNPGVTYTIKPGETISINVDQHKSILDAKIEDAHTAFDTGFYLLIVSAALFALASYATRNQP